MKDNEIYRSFDGILELGESGYRVVELNDYYEVNETDTRANIPDENFRVSKEYATDIDWSDLAKIGELRTGVKDGKIPGQYMAKGKWYSTELIHKIQNDHKDYIWWKYI